MFHVASAEAIEFGEVAVGELRYGGFERCLASANFFRRFSQEFIKFL